MLNKYFLEVLISHKVEKIRLTLKAQLQQMTFINISSFFFSEKIRFDVLNESSARQRIHLKHQALFSSKNKR